jgi:hypothetical protein
MLSNYESANALAKGQQAVDGRQSMVKQVTVVRMVSDRHGLLRKEPVHALKKSDLIILAGDVGPEILDVLNAPVFIIRGEYRQWKIWPRTRDRPPGPLYGSLVFHNEVVAASLVAAIRLHRS